MPGEIFRIAATASVISCSRTSRTHTLWSWPAPSHFVTEPIELPDGRKVRVSAYPDGSIRFRVDGLPYVLTEVYLSGNPEKDNVCPHLFQTRVDKAFDVRVTAVGHRLFGARVDSPDLDWRRRQNLMRCGPMEVPEAVRVSVIAYLTHFRLVYGAFDFAPRPVRRRGRRAVERMCSRFRAFLQLIGESMGDRVGDAGRLPCPLPVGVALKEVPGPVTGYGQAPRPDGSCPGTPAS
ncbi:hypothetical protein ACWGH7_05470 [Streptomyces cyaneofuscatus]|uniref:hypothetical protein n=1 Tax=Streptomyces cyaneofuscatus TaxID=66883 RepID=UPI002FEEE5AB